MFRAIATTLLAIALAALVAGCGGSDRVEYERDLAKVGRIVDDALAKLPQDDTTTIGPEQVATLADQLREAADQLEDLDPPDGAAAPQARLERGLRGIATAFDELATNLQGASSDEQKAEVFVQFATDQKVDAAFDHVVGAQQAYSAKGFRVFGSAARATG